MNTAPFVDVKNLRRAFDVSKPWLNRVLEGGHLEFLKAVDGVTFDIAKGETFALVGESGSGKTTVARMVVGLLPPSSGEVTIDGVSMSAPRQLQARQHLRRRIQMIFQDPYASLNPRFRVDAIVAEPIRAFDLLQGERNIQTRVSELLNLVGLHADDGWKYPHEFSGGQRQRIAIARVLASEAEFIVCDEPTSALDVSVQAQILNLMRDLQDKFGLTYLFISHNLAVVRHMASRIGVMYLGRIVEIAEGRELFKNPRMPYTKMLLGAVPDLAMSGRQRIPVKGEIPNPIDPPPGCAFNPRCPLAFVQCRRIEPPESIVPMSNINPDPFTTRPEIEGTFGVVTSTHWIATAVGMAILEKGGNAFDAGVATAFTLQVVEPHLNGPGGDVPIIVHDVKRGRTEVICGQGPAPSGATIAHYRSEGLEMVPGTGLLAACVPGTFESWMLLLRDYGTLRLRDVLEPAIAYARNGYPLVERASATIATVEQMFREHWTTSAAVYLPNDEVPKPGTLFTNKRLSETYARILQEAESAGADRVAQIERARKAWSHGFVAEAIDRFCRTHEIMDVSGSPHRGVLRADDMARWQPSVEAPLTYDYGRYTVCKPGVWSQGPVMLQQLALLKGFELDGFDPAGPEFIHLQIECAKLAFAVC